MHWHPGPAAALCGHWPSTQGGITAPPLPREDGSLLYSSQTTLLTRHVRHACRAAQQGIIRPHPIFRRELQARWKRL